MFDRITFDPRIIGGRAAIRGMRIPVSVIVGQICARRVLGSSAKRLSRSKREDIQQALSYAAWLTQEEVMPI